MFRLFEGRTADEVWQRIATAFRAGDETRPQVSRAGDTYEILHASISIADPRQRWIPSRRPPINPAFSIAEIVWVMMGRNDSAFLNYFNRELPKFAGCGPTYHGAYGYRLRHHLGVDQLERAYRALKKKSYSRQVVLQIWDSSIDLPKLGGEEASPDVPCNIMSMLKVRGGKLEWMQILRSSDLHRGLPYDLGLLTTLQEVMAGWLGLEPGSYNHISDSLHVYSDCMEQVCGSSPIEVAPNLDSLALPKRESEEAFHALEHQIEHICNPNTAAKELVSLVQKSQLPQGFRNMLCVLCAEGVRRRRQGRYVSEIMDHCTNPALMQLYVAWLSRVSRPRSEHLPSFQIGK